MRVSFLRVSDLRAKEGCEWVTIGNREHHRSRVTSYRIEMEEAASVGDAHARGKHMILAELGRVEQEVRFLEVRDSSSSFYSIFSCLIHTCSMLLGCRLFSKNWLMCSKSILR